MPQKGNPIPIRHIAMLTNHTFLNTYGCMQLLTSCMVSSDAATHGNPTKRGILKKMYARVEIVRPQATNQRLLPCITVEHVRHIYASVVMVHHIDTPIAGLLVKGGLKQLCETMKLLTE